MSERASVQSLNMTQWMDDEIEKARGEDESFSQTITKLIENLHKDRKKLNAAFISTFNEFELTQRFGDKTRYASYYFRPETLDLINKIGDELDSIGGVRYLKQRKNSYNLQLIIRMALYWNNPPK